MNKKHMVNILNKDEKTLYQCEECALKYESKEIAEKCQAWCGVHKSCNLDIIKNAVKEPIGGVKK